MSEPPGPAALPESVAFRPPRQERSRRTLERIVEAARALVAEAGPEALTVQEVVARAGSSVGSFYARFDARDDLLRYLEARVWSEAREAWEEELSREAWEGCGLREMLEDLIRLLLRLHREHFAAGRSLAGTARAAPPSSTAGPPRPEAEVPDREAAAPGLEAPDPEAPDPEAPDPEAPDPEAPDPEEAFHARALRSLGALLRDRGDEIGRPLSEASVEVGYRLVLGGIEALEGRVEEEALIRELGRVWACHFGAGEEPGLHPEEEAADFFDPWG